MNRRMLILAGALVLALGVAACGSGSSSGSAATSKAPSPTATSLPPAPAEDTFGTPADPTNATRTADIKITNSALAFDPTNVQVKTGETVGFVVSNDSDVQHEFVLGDEATQAEHREEMAGHGSHAAMGDEANGFLLPPHTTKTLAWTFTEPGSVPYGCNVAGHWEAGMRGTVEVSG